MQLTPSVGGGAGSESLPSRLTDIASCHVTSTLYASDLANCRVLRLRPHDAQVTDMSLQDTICPVRLGRFSKGKVKVK